MVIKAEGNCQIIAPCKVSFEFCQEFKIFQSRVLEAT